MTKKKILLVNESCLNNTGYSVMGRELLPRLNDTNKYEIAELAVYARTEDERNYSLPWKVYPVMPAQDDKEGWAQYNASSDGQFGRWCFERVLLDFKPDVVLDFRDPYHFLFEALSPLREYYSLLWMPTVDAYPQTDDWANQYMMADSILTYTDFGYRTLDRICGKSINLVGVASPGASFTDMGILDKNEIRDKYDIPKDIVLLGMVARNQIRKGYPDLFETFRRFIDIAPKELADKTFLHIHTGYPDAGWDIPRILKEDGISHKVYFTYICRACANTTINKWNDISLNCKRCGNRLVFLTNPAFGVSRKTLCEIYNLYDLYVQYAFLEGFGVPVVEAAACGVPIATIPYSAMEDFVDKLSAYPIPIAKMITETSSHREWAYPDNNKFAHNLIDILTNTDLKKWGEETYLLCKEHFDWDKSAKVCESAIDNIAPPKRKWSDPPRYLKELPVNQSLDDAAFIKECFSNIAFCDHLKTGFLYKMFLRNLYNQQIPGSNQNGMMVPFNKQNIINECKALQQAVVHWEAQRCR